MEQDSAPGLSQMCFPRGNRGSARQCKHLCRFPVMVCPLAGENGGEGEPGGTAQALVQITLVKQAGGPRGQVYYPFISFRVAKTLQVNPALNRPS